MASTSTSSSSRSQESTSTAETPSKQLEPIEQYTCRFKSIPLNILKPRATKKKRRPNKRPLPDSDDEEDPGPDDIPHPKRFHHPKQQWSTITHLNGGLYYHSSSLRLSTSSNVYNPKSLKYVSWLREQIVSSFESRDLLRELPEDWEIFLVQGKDAAEDRYPMVRVISYAKGQSFYVDKQGIRYAPKIVYWSALEKYPMHRRTLPINAEAEFLSALTYGATERVLNRKNTTFPFTDAQIQRIVQVYKDLKARQLQEGDKVVIPALIWHIARVMIQIERSREMYKFGTRDNHIYRNISHPRPSWKVRLVDATLMFILLGAHTAYRKRLLRTRVKKEVYVPDFRELMSSLLKEWADTNLLATVFVSANVAFIAVPNIDGLQRTASLCSSLFAMISIVAGVHHVWQHRGKTDVELKDAHQYLHHVEGIGEELDLTVTACFLSLPLVSLLWSIVSFTVAVGAFCFQNTQAKAGVLLLAVVLGICCVFAICLMFFFWHIWRQPPHQEIEDNYHYNLSLYIDPPKWWERLEERIKGIWSSVRTAKTVEEDVDDRDVDGAPPNKRPRFTKDRHV